MTGYFLFNGVNTSYSRLVRTMLLALTAVAVLALNGCSGRNAPAAVPGGSPPKAVPVAEVLAEIDGYQNSRIDQKLLSELKAELRRLVLARGEEKITLGAPEGAANQVRDLTTIKGAGTGIQLVWTEVNTGDYDQNSEVNINDLGPIGQHFGVKSSEAGWAVAKVADGDHNGEVNLGDLVPIASNYKNKVEGYHVYRNTVGEQEFSIIDTVARDDAELLSGALVYSYLDATDDDSQFNYQIRPYHGTDEGASSWMLTASVNDTFGLTRDHDLGDPEVAVQGTDGISYVKDEILLHFDTPPTVSRLFEVVNNDIDGSLLGQISRTNIYRVRLNLVQDRTASALIARKGASAAEDYTLYLNEILMADTSPAARACSAEVNDPVLGEHPWAWDCINAPEAWDVGTGSGVVVAVLDTGVDMAHEDLAGQCLTGHNAINKGTDVEDANGHGTHVAGTIAAAANNTKGISGVAPASRILPVKVLGNNGLGSLDLIADGMVWAILDGQCDIINMSLTRQIKGRSDAMLREIEEIDRNFYADIYALALENGVLIVNAAGNETRYYSSYPGAYEHALLVGAMVAEGHQKADYSNTHELINLCAPGGDTAQGCEAVWSCASQDAFHTMVYAPMSGTSMACPHVAGVAALVKSIDPALTPADIIEILTTTADQTFVDKDEIGPLVNAHAAALAAHGGMHNVNPVADLGAAPLAGNIPLLVSFDAGGSSDSDGTIEDYSWDLNGDGTYGNTPEETAASGSDTAAYTYSTAGEYTAKVLVTDNKGGTGEDSVVITCNDPQAVAPDITAVAPLSGSAGAAVTFIATNAGGPVDTWSWDFGGGATPDTSSDASPPVTLGPAGEYNASVTATNAHGSDTFNFTLTVETKLVWAVEEVDNWYCRRSKIAIDDNDHPYIVYNSDDSFCCAWNESGPWEYYKLTNDNYVGMYPSIDIAPANVVGFIYIHNGSAPGDQLYRGWRFEGTFGLHSATWDGGIHTTFTDLEFNQTNSEWNMAFISPYNALQYGRHDGTAYHYKLVEAGCEPIQPDIAVASDGLAWFSYYLSATNQLRVANLQSDNQFNLVSVDDDAGPYSSIDLDSEDFAHISYYDVANEDLKYATNRTGEWVITAIDQPGNVGKYTSLVVDSQDRIHISYHDISITRLKYAYYDGASWSTAIVYDNGNTGYWTSIDVDSNDIPHISFTDCFVDVRVPSKLFHATLVEP